MTLDLDPIKARLDAATPGEWYVHANRKNYVNTADHCICKTDSPTGLACMRDADLIAHAPADLRALIAEVERLRAENAELRGVARGLADAMKNAPIEAGIIDPVQIARLSNVMTNPIARAERVLNDVEGVE